jgi:hypothetical protein
LALFFFGFFGFFTGQKSEPVRSPKPASQACHRAIFWGFIQAKNYGWILTEFSQKRMILQNLLGRAEFGLTFTANSPLILCLAVYDGNNQFIFHTTISKTFLETF